MAVPATALDIIIPAKPRWGPALAVRCHILVLTVGLLQAKPRMLRGKTDGGAVRMAVVFKVL